MKPAQIGGDGPTGNRYTQPAKIAGVAPVDDRPDPNDDSRRIAHMLRRDFLGGGSAQPGVGGENLDGLPVVQRSADRPGGDRGGIAEAGRPAPANAVPGAAAPARSRRGVSGRHITSIEFRTLREACGLGQREFGALIGAPLRSVQNWEMEVYAIPEVAATTVRNLDAMLREQANLLLGGIAREPHWRRPTFIALHRFKDEALYAGSAAAAAGVPFSSHPALLWRMMDGLTRLGIPYEVRWAETADAWSSTWPDYLQAAIAAETAEGKPDEHK